MFHKHARYICLLILCSCFASTSPADEPKTELTPESVKELSRAELEQRVLALQEALSKLTRELVALGKTTDTEPEAKVQPDQTQRPVVIVRDLGPVTVRKGRRFPFLVPMAIDPNLHFPAPIERAMMMDGISPAQPGSFESPANPMRPIR